MSLNDAHDHRNCVGLTNANPERIFSNLALDLPPNDYTPRNRDLVACLRVSKKFHPIAAAILYHHVTFHHPLVFAKFFKLLSGQPKIGALVRRLDLSHFNSLGFGRTRRDNGEAQSFTSKSLLGCLELLPKVREVLLQEHVDEDVNREVLETILFKLPRLIALDLCGAHKAPFVKALTETVEALRNEPQRILKLKNLSLHQCDTLEGRDIATLISRLPNLRILDLNHTRIDDEGLLSLPRSADLTHLNLGRCSQITGSGVVEFLTQHPAAKKLQYLNLSCDISRYRLLRDVEVDALLPALPVTLRSLNLNGAKLCSSHVPQLRRLASHLEELGISHCNLSQAEIRSLFESSDKEEDGEDYLPGSALRYIDLTAVASITQPALFSSSSLLLSPASLPLEVIEVSPALGSSLIKSKTMNSRLGWTVKEFGRRSWYVRDQGAQKVEDPGREWKMGSKWWGMRKVPVAWSEVGGIYGHYMYKA